MPWQRNIADSFLLMTPQKILLVIPSLAGGGAERVLLLLTQYLDRSKFIPVIVLFQGTNAYEGEIPPDVKVICLNKKSRYDFFRLIRSLARIIQDEEPALIHSFLLYANYLSVMAQRHSRRDVPVLLNQQINMTLVMENCNSPWYIRLLARRYYPKATGIICASSGVKEDLVTNFRIPEEKCKVIYNPCDIVRVTDLAQETVDHIWLQQEIPVLCACGRLTAQKNFPLLLRAIKLGLKEQSLRLIIIGEGEDRSEIEAYAAALGVAPYVSFLGFQSNPFKYFAKAAAFIVSSSFEGFGIVIVEAMACGVPVISTRCPSGPDEIISDGVNGLLVPCHDESAMAAAILRLFRDEPLRRRLAEAGRRRAQDFDIGGAVQEYERTFLEIIENKGW